MWHGSNTLTVIWLVSLFLLSALLFGYPLLVLTLAKIKGRTVKKSDNYVPFISIILPCYNVASTINAKIESILNIDYPREKFEIIAVESGSTDETLTLLKQFAPTEKIKLIVQPRRSGKPSAINQALKECKGSIIVLTDIAAKVEKNAIRELVKNFADSSVGAVVGNLTITPGKSIMSKMNHSFFMIFRENLRELESLVDSASTFSGELCAFRRDLLDKIEEDIISDDRYILQAIRERGYRSICDSSAHVSEPDAEQMLGQIAHKRRTVTGTIQGVVRFRHMLFNPKYGSFGTLILPAHLIRVTLLPILLLLVEALSLIIALSILSSFDVLFWVGTGVVFSLVLLGLLSKGRRILFALFYGVIVQFAILAGIVDYLYKRHTVLWTPIVKSSSEIQTK